MIAYIVFFSLIPAAICAFWSWVFGVSLDWQFYASVTGLWLVFVVICVIASYPKDRW